MDEQLDLELLPAAELTERLKGIVTRILEQRKQPSAWELVEQVERAAGLKARWELRAILARLVDDRSLVSLDRSYIRSLLASDDLPAAMSGVEAPRGQIESSIDSLLRQSVAYRSSKSFAEIISFMAKFRDYAPYNNMLVRVQNPSCGFFATERDWRIRYGRRLIEDARPMLILAPMHPVMLVYDLDQTCGPPLPQRLRDFAQFEGEWNRDWLTRTQENAAVHDRIRIDVKRLSTTNAGFATARVSPGWKMRIAIHDQLDEPSQYGVLCHELAHIYLGHLGADEDHWWPSRAGLDSHTMEIEAEATAFIVTSRLGLTGSSASYVSGHLRGDAPPQSMSLDLIAKVAGRIERMARERLRPRPERRSGNRDGTR